MVRKILHLGEASLYEICPEVTAEELPALRGLVEDLHDTLLAYRARHGEAHAITAPQIGVAKRLLYVHIDAPIIILNPILTFDGSETVEVREGCMCFPPLQVKVRRHSQCTMRYRNLDWQQRQVILQDDLCVLMQHMVDHLNGILAPMRAADERSLYLP